MRTIKFDDYRVEIKPIKTNSNYNLSVRLYRGKEKILVFGTIFRGQNKDIDILEYVLKSIRKK